MMVLQDILFPNLETCPSFEMYFHTDKGHKHAYVDPEAGVVRVPQWCTLSTDTYFNGFSIGKWVKYTFLSNLRLRLELSGEFRVELIHWQRLKNECTRAVVAEQICRGGEGSTFEIAFPDELSPRGIYACALYALGEGCAFHGGQYLTEVDEGELNPVDIALDICTYKREIYLERNLDKLRRDLIENPESPLSGHLEVFISDNGQTLDASRLSTDGIHIFPNKNVGGAGGFARGMIEIIDAPKSFSHVLLMDDDVLMNPDAILRTYRFLRLLKPEHADRTIAGSLMRLDKRHEQYESGAVMNSYILKPRKHNLDLRRLQNVLINEKEETIHYNGWWYSCIPMKWINNDNLPLPLFVHLDDVEFALRNSAGIITLNGVCLWHESFDNRYTSVMEYYEARNVLILYALRKPQLSTRRVVWDLMHRVISHIIRYRYNNCELNFKGIDDFMKGPDWLVVTDPEPINAQVHTMKDKLQPIEELDLPFREKTYVKTLKKKNSPINTLRIFFLNGLFLPSKGINAVNIGNCWPRNYYRRKAVLNYDEVGETGFVTRRSVKKSLTELGRLLVRMGRLLRHYNTIKEAYRQAEPILTSRSFWNEYLGL